MTWLDDLLGVNIYEGGTFVKLRRRLNFIGVDCSDNVTTEAVDVRIAGARDWKESVRLATAAALPAYTFTGASGTIVANGVGAMPNIDGVAPAVDDRLLLIGAGTTSDVHNGIWVVTSLGGVASNWSLLRATLSDESAEVTPGMHVYVEEGTAYGTHRFVCTNTGAIVLNTTPITLATMGSTVALVTQTTQGAVNATGAVANAVCHAGAPTVGGAWDLLVNANVDAAAAIDGTKISADFGAQTVSTDNDYISTAGNYTFAVGNVAPELSQATDPGAGATADDTTIAAQGASDAAGAGTSGNLLLRGGLGTVHAGNTDGNVAFHIVPANWQSMQMGNFISDAVTEPAGNPAAGVFEWSYGGSRKILTAGGCTFWLSNAGTCAATHEVRVAEASTAAGGGPTAVSMATSSVDGEVVHVMLRCVARGQTTGESAGYCVYGTTERTGGAVALFGGPTDAHAPHEEDAAWACTIAVAGNSIQAQLTHDAAEIVDWKLHMSIWRN
jgi:hypothetical protein